MYTIDIDTGGTFTDGYAVSDKLAIGVKVDTTPHDLTQCFAACIEEAAGRLGLTAASLLEATRIVRFSSTVATNTAVQMNGPKLGLLVSSGEEQRLYNGVADNPLFAFVPRHLVAGVSESAGPPQRDEIDEAVRRLLEQGARMLVISLRNAHLDPRNELAVRQVINASYPRHYLGAVPMLVSHQISRIPNDAVRTNTAVVNAYFHRALSTALYRAEDWTRQMGLRFPLLVVTADFGVSRVAKTRAISTYQSGPASGVRGAHVLAEQLGKDRVLSIDVGGTTSDISLVEKGRPAAADYRPVNGVEVAQRVPEIVSLGVGGGSRIRVDRKQITVGPDSQGAVPGPACFGLGGAFVTPTDIWLTLGYLAGDAYLGGRKRLHPDRAEAAIRRSIAEPLDLSLEAAAWRAKEAVETHLAAQILQQRPFADAQALSGASLFAVGGGAGLLAVGLAQKLGMNQIYFPAMAPVFSAFGSSTLDVQHRYEEIVARTEANETRLGQLITALERQAARDMGAEGFAASDISYLLEVDGFANGQQVESKTLEANRQAGNDVEAVIERLSEAVDAVVIRLSATCQLPKRAVGVEIARAEHLNAARSGSRRIRLGDSVHDAPVYRFDRVPCNARITGPAIIENDQTSILIPSDIDLVVDTLGGGVVELAQQ